MIFHRDRLHRAAADDVRAVLFADPRSAWNAPREPLPCDIIDLHSIIELGALIRAFPRELSELRDTDRRRIERHTRVYAAAGYRRIEEIGGEHDRTDAFTLESVELGSVYVEPRDRSYLHFGVEQLPQTGFPSSFAKDVKWRVTHEKEGLTLSLRGAVSLDVAIEHAPSDGESSDVAAAVLRACLPGLDGLVDLELPFDAVAAAGVPTTVETWLVDGHGERSQLLARHRISWIRKRAVDPALFSIPEGFRNLRAQKHEDEAAWHSLGGVRHRTPRSTAAQKRRASSAASASTATMNTLAATRARIPEPDFPECSPSTTDASSALEIRQDLLDAIEVIVNLLARRLDTVSARRDPASTDVELVIDWLAQLERFHRAAPGGLGDGLFCLLHDELGDGKGILDQMAVTLARQLLAAEPPLPLGGNDQPIELARAIEDEIRRVSANAAIDPADRFDALPTETRTTLREEVLKQRLGTIRHRFDGNFQQLIWPIDPDLDLLHVNFQLERLAVAFVDEADTLRGLSIELERRDASQPRIAFALALKRLRATITMTREPGSMFWLTAAGVLVLLGIVSSVAVMMTVLTLVGLGPFGLIVLLGLISVAPSIAVTGGPLLVAAVTYLTWDVSRIRLTLDDPVLRTSLSPDRAMRPEEVILDADRATLSGDVTVSVNSEIPSGMHQLFDAIVNFLLVQFDDRVREQIESSAVAALESSIRKLPHFRLPLPFGSTVHARAPFEDFSVRAPRNAVMSVAKNGVEERFLSAGAVTRMEFPFPGLAPFTTQVDRDLRDKLTARMEEVKRAGLAPRLGYAISQNLLNGIVFSQWLAGRFARDYNRAQIDVVFGTLGDQSLNVVRDVDSTVHVWAAASPQVFVTPRAYLETEARSYLKVCFPDVRICIGQGGYGKASSLEIRFSFEAVAHIAFGGMSNSGKRTLFTLEREFLHVLFDDRPGFYESCPIETQGLEITGSGFASVAVMDGAQRLRLLQALHTLLDDAALRLLRTNDVGQISFLRDTPRVDQQLYDQMLLVDFQPRHASVYAIIRTLGGITGVLPQRDEEDRRIEPRLELFTLTCANGAGFRSEI